jgi:hypothetical protein
VSRWLLVAVGILGGVVALGCLAALVSLTYGSSHCGPAQLQHDTKMIIHNVEQALVHYQADNDNGCPPSIDALVQDRYMAQSPRDKWGQPLTFRCPGEHVPDGADITSAGKDHLFGTADDINNWDM